MKSLLLGSLTIFVFASQAPAQQFNAQALAGTYVSGHDFFSSSLTLKPDGRYTVKSDDCTIEYLDTGTYVLSGGVLNFKVVRQTTKSHGVDTETVVFGPNEEPPPGTVVYGAEKKFKLTVVKWDDRTYLIDEADLKNFVNAVNLGLEPRSELSFEPYFGEFYLRQGDERKKISGKPSLGEEWLSFLLSEPIVATITKIEADGEHSIVTIDKGSRDGLRNEMLLLAHDEQPFPSMGSQIISVEEHSAKIRTSLDVKVGDRLTTRYDRTEFDRLRTKQILN